MDAVTSPSVDAIASPRVGAITGPTVDAIPGTAVVAIRCPAMDSSASPSAVDSRAIDSPVDAAHPLATSATSGIVAFDVSDTALIGEGD